MGEQGFHLRGLCSVDLSAERHGLPQTAARMDSKEPWVSGKGCAVGWARQWLILMLLVTIEVTRCDRDALKEEVLVRPESV